MLLATVTLSIPVIAKDNYGITESRLAKDRFTLMENGMATPIYVDPSANSAVKIAAGNLAGDFGKVGGKESVILDVIPSQGHVIAVGTIESDFVKDLKARGLMNLDSIQGHREQYVMTTVNNPWEGVENALIIVGSDRRGAAYGCYELSEQIGVSPWWDWADVAIEPQSNLSIKQGTYSGGEPAVTYRGLFLNDEAPCLTGWVENTYGTKYGDHRFYKRVGELIMRLRGNFLWPAMWSWAFYADDEKNSATADSIGLIIGTSHHEPMARNHQEWARHRAENGVWNYSTNQKTIDKFFREGMKRARNTEDVITIGMRGDGDEAMSEEADVKLLQRIINNQRKIIAKETGKPAKETPQVWALYKEVLDYYDKGLRAPDDVIYLLCDDNWGNVRRLPVTEEEKNHPGGWGMYYHVDYVGAPRNTKWLNVTPAAHMAEQLTMTAEYGVDKLWILNVGDLKPMEYPITLFMDLAWNPKRYDASTIINHTRTFAAQQFGEKHAEEIAEIIDRYGRLAGRSTAELLDANTYNIESGEWQRAADDFKRLEADALDIYIQLPEKQKASYDELVLYPIQAMANVYDMYYAVAMNRLLAERGDLRANDWADKAEKAFQKDRRLEERYNTETAGGKWNGMMRQKHIGYKIWNDNFPADVMPEVVRINNGQKGGFVSEYKNGAVVIEAEHFNSSSAKDGCEWKVIDGTGRTLSGVVVTPRTDLAPGEETVLTYKFSLPAQTDSVTIHVITRSTLAFARPEGHRFGVMLDKGIPVTVNFNGNLNEDPENIYTVFYPTVADRVVDNEIQMAVGNPDENGYHTLELNPMDPDVIFTKIVIDAGGWEKGRLFGEETPYTKEK